MNNPKTEIVCLIGRLIFNLSLIRYQFLSVDSVIAVTQLSDFRFEAIQVICKM